MSKLSLYQSDPTIQIINGVCPHDCPDTCSWQVAVKNGTAIDIWGDADQPITQGKLCGKVDRYLERTYHAGRLTTPLKRVGAKGSGQFVPISWDAALSEIAERLKIIIAEQGAEAVLPYSYAGTMGLLQAEGMAARFWNKMGASRLARTICSEAGFEGYSYTIGATEGMETESFAHARLILIWGSNTLTSNMHLWPFVQEARKKGGKVIVIDPARTRTAQAADEWIPIRPGTDGALALALINLLILPEQASQSLIDQDYIAKYTIGFDQLKAHVTQYTPEWAASITGIPAQRIRDLAVEYATTRPAAIRINYGLQRHYGGGMAVRTIACLPALIGAWKEYGGGIQLSTSGASRMLDRTGLQRPDLSDGRFPRTINMNRLGDALSLDPLRIAASHYHPRPVDPVTSVEKAGPPVKALVVYNCNPAAVAPDQSAVLQGLRRDDLFTVVLEHFQTDTADYADFVLPATTQLEHWDIHKAYGHLFIGLNRPAIPPVGESLPNSEIFRRLATAMGYTDDCFREDDETILRSFVEAQKHPRFATVTWERLMHHGFARLNVPDPYLPFAQGNFPTLSGKCEFYSERMVYDGYPGLPVYTAPRWQSSDKETRRQGDKEIDFTLPLSPSPGLLVCISPPAHSFLNSSFANLERFVKREEKPVVQIHPADAAQRGVVSGDCVRLFNELGEISLPAEVTEAIIPGTVLAPGVWWNKLSPTRSNINQITPQDETDMGASASFYDTLVWAEKISEST